MNKYETLRKVLLGFGGGLLISAAGLSQLDTSEGIKYTAYPDPATHGAPWTICRGHTGPEVHRGLTATQAQCDRWFAQDISKAESTIKSTVHVPMKQGEWDAAVSFIFNLGSTNWRTSTLLLRLNQNRRTDSCNQYPRWKYANGIEMEGLVVRRTKEQALCLQPGGYIYEPNH